MAELLKHRFFTQKLDHLGLVASILKELGISERINALFGEKMQVTKYVTVGDCVSAMILNGLGFANRRLYMVSRFFQNKPLERLISPNIRAEHLNDDALGKCLDYIAEKDPTFFFANITFPIAAQRKYRRKFARIDSTTFSLEGSYSRYDGEDADESQIVKITYGHSKERRPDLKQIVLSMVNSGEGYIPLWSEPLDGNSSDKISFHNTIARIRAFQKAIGDDEEFCWVADSALYSKEHLLKNNCSFTWITRVPENIKEARMLLERPKESFTWINVDENTKISEVNSTYGGIKQRWLVVYSQEGFERENNTLEKQIEKERTEIQKALWHLSNQTFACEADARNSFDKLMKQCRFHEASFSYKVIQKYEKRGRPRTEEEPMEEVIQVIKPAIVEKTEYIEKIRNTKGRFILATNDIGPSQLSPEEILKEYKSLQKVERGFRFLKDSSFLLDHIFLKTPNRIAALTAIMALCLFVYSIGEYELRKKLKESNTTLPNQLRKEVDNPTLRWVFEMMDGPTVLLEYTGKNVSSSVINISPLMEKIIRLFGAYAEEIYDIQNA